MTQSGQHDPCLRGRCPKHGLVSIWGEACSLCLEQPVRKARLLAAISSASTVGLIAAVLALGWHIEHHPSRAVQNKKAQGESLHPTGLNLKVVAARTRELASSIRAETESNAGHVTPVSAEDRHLGEPAPVPRVEGPPAPEPPRAAVDKEPESPDDPRDFDLSLQTRQQ